MRVEKNVFIFCESDNVSKLLKKPLKVKETVGRKKENEKVAALLHRVKCIPRFFSFEQTLHENLIRHYYIPYDVLVE